MQLVKVDLGVRSYDVTIGAGLFSACADFLCNSKYSKKVVVVTDEKVDQLYWTDFAQALGTTGFQIEKIVVPSGEQAKSLQWADKIYTKALQVKMDRKSPFIALGGGVVGDLTGFVAATYMRGVPFIQVPTTLLSQVDSSVGGKVAVNHPEGKNMIGAFHQPEAVFADTSTLKTLSARDYASGLAEIVKYACLEGEGYLTFLEENADKIVQQESATLAKMIAWCCEYKAKIVQEDEFESNKRMILNLGHTYGHAVEKEGNFSLYTHGEAVSIGLYGALLLSKEIFGLDEAIVQRVKTLLEKFNLPIVAKNIDAQKAYQALWNDKKAVGDNLQWALLKSLGVASVIKDVPIDLVRRILTTVITK